MKLRIPILLVVLAAGLATPAQEPKPARSLITGIAKVRILTSAPPDAQRLYFRAFGLASLPGSVCNDVSLTCLGLNEHQLLSLFPSYWPEDNSRISEITFKTSDANQLRNYLDSTGVAVSDLQGLKGGNRHFTVRDPEGHRIGFIQFSVRPRLNSPANQLSARLIHAGFVVKDRAAEDHFYKDILGFRLYWQGGFKDDQTDWVEMQVPDGSDWIEYMLNIPADADQKELGIQNHISLGVKDIHATAEQLRKNGIQQFDGPEVGRDGKWSLDAYDPDGTRVEFMEFTPVQPPCCHPYTAAHPKP